MRSSRRLPSIALCGLLLAAGGLAATSAHAAASSTTLTFDDLGPSVTGTHMVDGYGGFDWSSTSWHSVSRADAPADTYLALSGTATAIHRTDGTDFVFEGAEVWSRRGLDATGSFYYVLSRDGVVVYNGLNDKAGRLRFTGAPAWFAPNYTGAVDTVAIAFAQGGGDWDHLALDDFRVAELAAPAPAPSPVPTEPAPTPAPSPTPTPTVTTYKVVVKTAGKGSVAVSRTGSTFVAGTQLTLTATPAAGSTWNGWTGAVASSALSIVVTVTKDMTITANFK